MTLERLSDAFGRLLAALAVLGCVLLFVMLAIIVGDVGLRNIAVPGLPRGLSWANEISELLLYAITMCVAPWLLRQGQHIRVDIILRVLPVRVAWLLEWLGDIVGLLCCLYFVWYGLLITVASYSAGSINIKTLVTPEWWTLAPLPLGFVLLAIEFIFRMHRLASADVGLRDDAVSSA